MKIPLRLAGEPLPPPPGPVVLATGFRPFFLAAGVSGVLAVPLWLMLLYGGSSATSVLPGTAWHGHEMLFGYGGAVLAGFLLTAVRHWSGGRPTAANGPLALLVLAWVLGRVANAPGVPGGLWSAIPDVAWLLGLTWAIGKPLIQAKSKRNYGFLLALPLLAACTVALHHPAAVAWSSRLLELVLMVFVAILAVVGGRIVPLFTRNARPELGVESIPAIERLVPFALAAALLAPLVGDWPSAHAGLLGIAAAVLAARMVKWGSLGTRDEPLLWILHVGCVWLPVGLASLAAGTVGLMPASVGLHALSAGALGSLTIGMLGRVSLGHTGRTLAAGTGATVAFATMVAAGIARTVAPLFGTPTMLLMIAGTLWSVSLLVWLVVYTPILISPRADGKPG